MKPVQRTVAAALLCAGSLTAYAGGLDCKTNAMTDERTCMADVARTKGGFYFAGYESKKLSLVVTVNGLSSSWRPDVALFRTDGGEPFKVEAHALRPDVNCSRYGGCEWTATAVVVLNAAQWRQLASAKEVLLAVGVGSAVSDPIKAEPQVFAAWLAQFAAQGITPPSE